MILNLFHGLEDGHSIELISSHSLAPLNRLFHLEMPGFFIWTDLEQGPEVWIVNIRKTDSPNLTINEIIWQNIAAIDVLENRGIPYYKLGTSRLSDITKDAGDIYQTIRKATVALVNPLKTDYWSVGFTVDYVINNHHAYIKAAIPELEDLMEHLVAVHADTHPELPMISDTFSAFKAELEEHMKDEEEIVFPSFKALEKAVLSGNTNAGQTVNDSMNWIEEDHVLTGTSLKYLRNFCNNYLPPDDSSPGFKILFEELKKFEYDMHFHMHLENNVLFSKVMNLLQTQTKTDY